jgi:hypothetical protein
MRRILIAFAILAMGRAIAGPRCTTRAAADASILAAHKANDARYATALAARKLSPISLRAVMWSDDTTAVVPDTVEDRIEHGKKLRALMRGLTVTGGCRRPLTEEFAETGTKIYRVVRKPAARKTAKQLVCGCVPELEQCGGAAVKQIPMTYGFEVPDGASYEGVVEIKYVTDDVILSYAESRPCLHAARP